MCCGLKLKLFCKYMYICIYIYINVSRFKWEICSRHAGGPVGSIIAFYILAARCHQISHWSFKLIPEYSDDINMSGTCVGLRMMQRHSIYQIIYYLLFYKHINSQSVYYPILNAKERHILTKKRSNKYLHVKYRIYYVFISSISCEKQIANGPNILIP